jgi:hypothetical protein
VACIFWISVYLFESRLSPVRYFALAVDIGSGDYRSPLLHIAFGTQPLLVFRIA